MCFFDNAIGHPIVLQRPTGHDCFAAETPRDFRSRLRRLVRAGVSVQRDAAPLLGQRYRDRSTDSRCTAAGYQGDWIGTVKDAGKCRGWPRHGGGLRE